MQGFLPEGHDKFLVKAKIILAECKSPLQELVVRQGRIKLTRTHGIDMDSRYKHRLMVYTWTHGIDKDPWYRQGLMVLTTPMIFT